MHLSWQTGPAVGLYTDPACVYLHVQKAKAKATEGSPEQKLQPERTLGWAASRLESCKKDLQLHIDNSNQ